MPCGARRPTPTSRCCPAGERRRVALCKLLLQQPDLLLLDEPTNHLDAESVQWLEQHLEKYPGTVVAITHDRYFLDNVAQWILELDRGRAYPYEGNYSTYLDTKAKRLKVEGQKDAKLRRRLEDELAWVRSNAKARQTKSRARLDRYEEMAAEAEKTRKLDFEEIQIPPGPRLGSVVVESEHLMKGFGDRLLMEDLSFTLPRNGIVGVIGPNGVGKTTLFKMIVAASEGGSDDKDVLPDSGSLRVGDTVTLSYVDQSSAGLDPTKNVWEVVSDGLDWIKVGHVEMPSRAYVSAFGFKGPDQQKPAAVLSGRRAQPAQPGHDAEAGRQPAAARRAHQRPRRRDPRQPRERAAGVPRLCRHHLARPLVPRPDRDAHPRLRGRLAVVLVRGQLRVLREEQDRPARGRRGPAAPRHVPQADARLMLEHRVQLRWADLDPLNHVNNVRLMEYLQEARLALLFELGLVAGDVEADYGQVVARNEVDYLRPLFLTPDPLVVRTWVDRIGRTSYTLGHEVVGPDGEVAARATTVLVVTDAAVTGSRPIPDPLRAALAQHLRG